MALIHVHAATYSGRRSRNKCNNPPRPRKCYRSREQRESVAKFMARNCARSVSYNTVINHLPTMILFAASGPSVTYRDAPRTAGDDTSPRCVISSSALAGTGGGNGTEREQKSAVVVTFDVAHAIFEPVKISPGHSRRREAARQRSD